MIAESLLHTYEAISVNKGNSPVWAVHKRNAPNELVHPTIPFIGKKFEEQPKKILVYASAENLTNYYPGNTKHWAGDWLDEDIQARNRHRKCFDDQAFQYDSFFPHVHLEPMNNGCLATAVYYIASKLYPVSTDSPRDFYETIAFGNYGKYSIETERQRSMRLGMDQGVSKANIDYAGNQELLKESHPFIRADIEILKPDYIILPGAMYRADTDFINEHRGSATIIPIHQMNTRVINLHVAPKYGPYKIEELSSSVQLWYDHLQQGGMTGKNKDNYLSVFTYLDDVLKNCGCYEQ